MIIEKLLPPLWRDQIRKLASFQILTRRDITVIGSLSLLSVALEAFGMSLILPLLDFVQADRDISVLTARSELWVTIERVFRFFGLRVSLLGLSLIILLMVVLRQIVSYTDIMIRARVRQRFARESALICFRTVMESQAHYIQTFTSGRFANLIAVQCNAGSSQITAFAESWRQFVTVAAYAVVVTAIAPFATLLAAVVVVTMVVSLNRFTRAARLLGEVAVSTQQAFANTLTQQLLGWRNIKISRTVPFEYARVGDKSRRMLRVMIDLARINARVTLIVVPVMTFITMTAFYVSVEYLHLSLAALTMFIIILMRLTPVATGITAVRQSIAQKAAPLNAVFAVIEEARRNAEVDDGVRPFEAPRREITYQNASFRYDQEGRAAIWDVSATIPAGKLTAIVGPSGAGKSTLVDLLLRLIRPSAGNILVDGVPLDEFTLDTLRAGIAYASQRAFLFDATVADNVRYGIPEATMKEVEEACRLAHADEFIRELPDGYDSRLGELGSGLSGGQGQRLVLARVFLAKAAVLILDEPMSALDYESEAKVRAAVSGIIKRGNVTAIVIAHQYSTVRQADHVIVLRDGRVLAEGSPQKLRASDEWFSKMVEGSAEPENARDAGEKSPVRIGPPL